MESLIRCYAGSRKSKRMPLEWLVAPKSTIITPVLKDLHWLPIRKRIEFKILLLTFKCMQGCAPLYLRELLIKQANTRTLGSNTKNVLQIPHTYLKRCGDRAFCAYAPRLWNELLDNIKAADSVQETAENIAISKGVYLTIWTMTTVH